MIQGKQDNANNPAVFCHILESLVTDRIRNMYEKNEERLLKIYKTPYKSLVGLVNNQIQLVHVNILLETINSKPSHERPPENEDSSEFFKSIKLDQPPKYIPRYIKAQAKQDSLPLGSDDITIPEDLE